MRFYSKFLKDLPSVCFRSEIHGGEVMRINMCAAIIVMQCVFLIGAHVKAQQVILKFSLPFSLCQMFCHYAHNGFNQNHLAVKRKNKFK